MNETERSKYSYLGDGVYAFYDGYGIWLRTGHHEEARCDDKVYIEPDILHNLNRFYQRQIEIAHKEATNDEPETTQAS